MKDHLQTACLAHCEERLEALGLMVERQIYAILLHVANEMPLGPATSSEQQTPNVKSVLGRSGQRANARNLLELYSNRMLKLSQATEIETPADMITYAQLLDQALCGQQTLQ
jgi:hypothetical protein